MFRGISTSNTSWCSSAWTNGIKHVGSHFGGIGGMEILLLGPNLPHNWLVNKRSAPVGTDTDYQVVIHFPKSVFGAGFFELAPFAEINELLKKSELGLCFKDGETARIGKEMEAMLHMKEFDRSMALLELLQRLSAKEHTVLSSYGFNNVLNEEKVKRMNKVFKYITINYKENISLEDIAGIANMTPAGFRKYFKERTHKTFIEFVNEVRIGHAANCFSKTITTFSRSATNRGSTTFRISTDSSRRSSTCPRSSTGKRCCRTPRRTSSAGAGTRPRRPVRIPKKTNRAHPTERYHARDRDGPTCRIRVSRLRSAFRASGSSSRSRVR